MFNENKEYRELMLINQFRLPRSLEYIAERFGNELTYNQIIDLYKLAVKEVLIFYKIDCIIDLPWGEGYVVAKNLWKEKLITAIKIKEEL